MSRHSLRGGQAKANVSTPEETNGDVAGSSASGGAGGERQFFPLPDERLGMILCATGEQRVEAEELLRWVQADAPIVLEDGG